MKIENCKLQIGERIPVYILAGGRSRRFGSDKARALLHGKPLILHVAEALRPLASAITVVAERSQMYEDLGLRTIADERPGLGPLGGLVTALSQCDEPWMLAVACDFPGVQRGWIETLVSYKCIEAQAVAFKSDRWQPLPALYHHSLRPVAYDHIRDHRLALQTLFDRVRTIACPLPADWPAASGVNTPPDLETLEREGPQRI